MTGTSHRSGALAGARVLVTRPRGRAEALCFLLEDEGAEVIALPLLELLPPEDPRPLRAAAESVHRYAWIAFASPMAVEAVADAARQAGTSERLSKVHLAAVGPKTSAQLRALGLEVAVELSSGGGAALAEAMRERISPGDEVLLPAAEAGREELGRALEELGARVTRVCAYRSLKSRPSPEEVASLAAHPPQAAIFGSPRTVEAFLEALGPSGPGAMQAMKRIAIGPTTAAALERAGFPASAVAASPTPEGLLEATARAVRG